MKSITTDGSDPHLEAIRIFDALPGTKPDAYSSRVASEFDDDPERIREEIRVTIGRWRADGMTWFRVTHTDDGIVWIECWRIRPQKEAEFDPPYTTEATR